MDAKVLIVDDSVANLIILEDYLSEFNNEIITAENGEVAYRLAIEQSPDIILMDWEMPVMNGIESLKLLKKNEVTKDIPVIIVTGNYIETQSLQEAFSEGAIDFIKKPIERIELIARVKSVLGFVKYYRIAMQQSQRELSTSLLQQTRLTGFYNQISQKLSLLSQEFPSTTKVVEELNSSIAVQLVDEAWKNFEVSFAAVNVDFYKQLSTAHPYLTPSEIKLCTLLRLNMDSKEIAAFLHQEETSIRVSRSRLRKKIGINTEDSLTNYLMRF
jgi:response regulator RpfG family c-di-GMP phosphodiesterase